jgi:hypothetical protein
MTDVTTPSSEFRRPCCTLTHDSAVPLAFATTAGPSLMLCSPTSSSRPSSRHEGRSTGSRRGQKAARSHSSDSLQSTIRSVKNGTLPEYPEWRQQNKHYWAVGKVFAAPVLIGASARGTVFWDFCDQKDFLGGNDNVELSLFVILTNNGPHSWCAEFRYSSAPTEDHSSYRDISPSMIPVRPIHLHSMGVDAMEPVINLARRGSAGVRHS